MLHDWIGEESLHGQKITVGHRMTFDRVSNGYIGKCDVPQNSSRARDCGIGCWIGPSYKIMVSLYTVRQGFGRLLSWYGQGDLST